MHGIPDGPGGVQVTADAFGAQQAKAIGGLGRAIGQAGEAHMQWTRRNAESRATAEMASVYMKGMDEDRIRILQSAGGAALEADQEMEEAIRRRSDASRKSLKGNPLAQSLFDEMRLDFDRQNVHAARSHKESEQQKFELASNQAYKQSLIDECARPGGNNFAGIIEKINVINAKMYASQPPQMKTWQDRADAFLAIKARAESENVKGGPMAALGFLDADIDKFVGDGMMKVQLDTLREKYRKEGIAAEQNAFIDNGTAQVVTTLRNSMDPGAAMAVVYRDLVAKVGKEAADRAFAKHAKWTDVLAREKGEAETADRQPRPEEDEAVVPEERRSLIPVSSPDAYAMIIADTAEAERRAIQVDQVTAAVSHDRNLQNELAKTGFEPTRMASWTNMTVEEKSRALSLSQKYRGSLGAAKVSQYLVYQGMTDEELLDVLSDPGRRDKAFDELGGPNSKWFERVFTRIDRAQRGHSASGNPVAQTYHLDSELETLDQAVRQAIFRSDPLLDAEQIDLITDAILIEADAEIAKKCKTVGVNSFDDLTLKDKQVIHDELTSFFLAPDSLDERNSVLSNQRNAINAPPTGIAGENKVRNGSDRRIEEIINEGNIILPDDAIFPDIVDEARIADLNVESLIEEGRNIPLPQMVDEGKSGLDEEVDRKASGKATRGVISFVDNSHAEVDTDPLLPKPLDYQDLSASVDAQGRRIINRGVGRLRDFHGNWGERFNIQDPEIIKSLNNYFRDPHSLEMFPPGITVRAHPNGDSLVYEWVDAKTGDLIRWQQTARPSWQIDLKGMAGYWAEETPWGFMATKDFDEEIDSDAKAKTIVHEFYHQAFQIGEQGKLSYLLSHRGQFLRKSIINLLKKREELQHLEQGRIGDAYYSVRQEQEAYAVSDMFDAINKDYRQNNK